MGHTKRNKKEEMIRKLQKIKDEYLDGALFEANSEVNKSDVHEEKKWF